MTNVRVLPAVNLVAVPATIAFNGWVNARPLNDVTTGEISAAYPSLFTPPGWAFSIWGLIYAALLVFSIYQVRPGQRSRPYLSRIGWFHAASALCNCAWLVVFHFSFGRPGLAPVTLIPMYLLFGSLLAIYLRLRIGLDPVGVAEKLAVHLPFSLYLGWITVAAMVNTSFALNSLIPGIPLAIQRGFTLVLLLAVLAVGLLILRNRRDFVFALVIVWTTVGIAAERSAYPEIAVTAGLTALVVAGTVLLLPFLRGQNVAACYFGAASRR
jgi:hypothetical protein